MAKVRNNPQEIASKQIRRVQDSIPDIEAGINRVTVSPTELAAQNLEKAETNYVKSIRSGKMARNLRAVTLAEWKARTLAKIGRISSGIEESRTTLEKFHKQRNEWQNEIDSGLASIPTKSLEDSRRRMIFQMDAMAKKSFDKAAN